MTEKSVNEFAQRVAAAYMSFNSLPDFAEVARVISMVHSSFENLRKKGKLVPAVDVKKSVRGDRIVCLEDGDSYKSLARHLKAAHGLTPSEYRKKWGLPNWYPMVAPALSKKRSAAQRMGSKSRKSPSAGPRK